MFAALEAAQFVINCIWCRWNLVHEDPGLRDNPMQHDGLAPPQWRTAKRSRTSLPQHHALPDQAQIPQQIEADSGAAYSHHLAGHQPLPTKPLPTKRRRIDQIGKLPVNQAFGADPPRSRTASIIEGVSGSALLPAPLAGTASAMPHESQSAASTLQPPGHLDHEFFTLMGPPGESNEFFTLMGPPGESSMMSQPGFGIGCSSACGKLPLRSASDEEAFVRRNREVALCVLVFLGLLQSQYFPDGVRKYVMTLVWLLVGGAYLSPRTRSWLVTGSPKIYAVLTPLPPLFALLVNLNVEAKHGVLLFADSPGHMIFRAFMQGAGNAALCGGLRLQIASSVALHIGIFAICWYRWQILQSSVGSGDLSGILALQGDEYGMAWQYGMAVFVVQWLGLMGTNLLIWKVLRPLSQNSATQWH